MELRWDHIFNFIFTGSYLLLAVTVYRASRTPNFAFSTQASTVIRILVLMAMANVFHVLHQDFPDSDILCALYVVTKAVASVSVLIVSLAVAVTSSHTKTVFTIKKDPNGCDEQK